MPDAASALAALLLHDGARFDATGKQLANQTIEMPVVGHSMEPTLADGTIIRVRLGDGANCATGDIVVFRQHTQIVAHRVVHRTRTHLLTRGDGRRTPDEPVPFAAVLGWVIEPPAFSCRRSAAVAITIGALSIHPSLAKHCAALMTWIERRSARYLGAARRHLS